MSRAAVPIPKLSNSDINRFHDKVRRGAADACWPWQAAKGDGYGRFKVSGKLYGAHRIAYHIAHGPIPEKRLKNGLILHSCHNPACCNPAHLRLGTGSQNNEDAVRAGRWDVVAMNLPRVRRSKLLSSRPQNDAKSLKDWWAQKDSNLQPDRYEE
jgi:hypothetical protein